MGHDTLVTVGAHQYRIVAAQNDGRWTAWAIRDQSGERFGPGTSGETETEATERLARWLSWQHAHGIALAALQEAERAYHRSLAAALANGNDEADVDDLRRTHLERVQDARAQLDILRARRPE